MANITDLMADLAISRSLLLQRIANGLSRDVSRAYQEIIDDVSNAVKTADEITLKNMKVTISELKSRINPDIDFIKKDLTDLADIEANYIKTSTNAITGISMFSQFPTEKTIKNIYKTSMIEGAFIGERFSSLNKSMQTDLERAIRIGVTSGEVNHEMA